MIITIHQPDFAPWLGFFDRWRHSDLYIVLDDVQFLRRGWHHRDRIKTDNGPCWLTIPVLKKGKYKQRINEVLIDNNTNWRTKHLRTITHAYGNCPGFSAIFPALEKAYGRQHGRLMDFNIDILKLLAEFLGINTPMVMASAYPSKLTSTARLAALTATHKGTVYLTGTGSRDYLDETIFENQGISVEWQTFKHPNYPQANGHFETGMSTIDFLMNTGNMV